MLIKVCSHAVFILSVLLIINTPLQHIQERSPATNNAQFCVCKLLVHWRYYVYSKSINCSWFLLSVFPSNESLELACWTDKTKNVAVTCSSVFLLGFRAVAEMKRWGAAPDWQWHYTYAPFDMADSRDMCSTRSHIMFDPNWGGRCTMLWSETRGRSQPGSTHSRLIRTFPASRHGVHWITPWRDKVTKLTKAGIKNLKPSLIRDQQD